MKKKIINGILLAAMLFAGTTSFVSCKDNVDDELVPVWTDLTKLQGRVSALENTVAGHTQDIANLRSDLTALEARVAQNEADIATLNAEYEALDAKITEFENYVKTMEVGVIVQGTEDPVFGRLNGAIISKNTLCGFVGKNGTGISEFPVIDGDGKIFYDNKLTTDEVPADDYIEFNAENKYLNEEVNLGKVYLTLNPIGADATKCDFQIMNTVGQTTGAVFGTPVPNTTILTESFLSRNQKIADYVAYNEFPVVWEVPVSIATTGEDFDSNVFDYLNFGGEGSKYASWNLNNLKASFDEIWNTLTKQDGGATPRYQKYSEAMVKLNKLFGVIKDGIDAKRAELNNYGVYVTNPESGRSLFSKADVVSVVMEPISYQTAKLFDDAGVKFDLTKFKAEMKRIIGKVQEKFPDIPIKEIKLVQGAGNKLEVEITTDLGVFYDKDLSAISGGTGLSAEQVARYNDMLNGFLSQYKYLVGSPASEGNHIADDLVNKAENFLNLMATDLIDTYFGGAVAKASVEPILLMAAYDAKENYLGMVNLADQGFGLPNKLGNAGTLNVVLTSLTKDFIVPVYKKYIGVVQDGKLMEGNYTIADGNQQVFSVDIPEGKSTIVIQTLDYAGNVITKKFDVEAKAAE